MTSESVLPRNLTFTALKKASADFNSVGEPNTRLILMLGSIADIVAREAAGSKDDVLSAEFYAAGGLFVIEQRLHRITRGFVRDAFGLDPAL